MTDRPAVTITSHKNLIIGASCEMAGGMSRVFGQPLPPASAHGGPTTFGIRISSFGFPSAVHPTLAAPLPRRHTRFMPLSWNEIRHRAIAFSKDWADVKSETAEKQTFWNDFFSVFGVRRRTVATFEEPVRKLSGNWGFIDLFWPGRLLVEHKSDGADLGKAHAQGMDYIRGLKDSGRDREIPRWLIVSDFARLALHDLEPEEAPDAPLFQRIPPTITFPLADLHKHIRHFAFIAGYTQHRLNPEDPANLEATELMCHLHDALERGGYTGHELKRFLVRILFCLFAEDNGIFPQKAFELLICDRTAADGSDLGIQLAHLFQVLNTEVPQRQRNLDEELSQFPYVNGDLFGERLDFAEFNADMRNGLLACCRFRWETISPAVFGSLFQSVMDSQERRRIGGHYTAEKNILKTIRSLFLDDLRAEFAAIKTDRSTRRTARLQEFQTKLAKLRFLDPACGCGNFLVLTYRELRKLELEALLELFGQQHEMSLDDVTQLSKLNVNQFYGIELEEFPARIAEVALWLTDHQANIALSQAFGQFYDRLPLRASPHIRVGNALRLDWREVIPPAECSYILGNPPFVGKQFMTAEQKADMDRVCGKVKGAGVLDYVTGWYFTAAEYVRGTPIRCAFVSTNSVSQGEQPGILWGELYGRHRMKIHFAHRTFPWESEARGEAHVHVVIIGFGATEVPAKFITDYDTDPDNPTRSSASNINPYLVEGRNVVLVKRTKPICAVPEIVFGSMPNDGGHLLLDAEGKAELLQAEPGAKKFLRQFLGSEEFINGLERWCLWLDGASPSELRALPEVMRRVRASKGAPPGQQPRDHSRTCEHSGALWGKPPAAVKVSAHPWRFIRAAGLCSHRFSLSAGHREQSGERCPGRRPVSFRRPHLADAHGVDARDKRAAWRAGYRYSAAIVYNNFPWPMSPTAPNSRWSRAVPAACWS